MTETILGTEEQFKPNNQQSPIVGVNKSLMIISGILVVFSLGAAGFLYWQNRELQAQITQMNVAKPMEALSQTENNIEPTPLVTNANLNIKGWKNFSDTNLGVSFRYPDNLEVAKNESFSDGVLVKRGKVTMMVISKNPQLGLECVKEFNTQNYSLDEQSLRVVEYHGTTEGECQDVGNPNQQMLYAYISYQSDNYVISTAIMDQVDRQLFLDILSTFRFTGSVEPTIKSSTPSQTYVPGKDWQTVTNASVGIKTCLPPKWEFDLGMIYFNRDPQFRPATGEIKSFAYKGGSRREEFINYLTQFDNLSPEDKAKIKVSDVSINGKSFLKISSPGFAEFLVTVNGNNLYGVSGTSTLLSQDTYMREIYTIAGCLKSI
jgi:hypothetical protein